MKLFEAVKTVIFLTVFLALAPLLFEKIKENYSFLFEQQTLIAIIPIPNQCNNASELTKHFHDCFKDNAIKGIVITINSSETQSGTSQTIFHDIRHLKKDYPKPIIALIENSCLAGTYLIASACDYIIASESALIGKIGPAFIDASLDKSVFEENIANAIKKESYTQLTKQVALSRKLSLTTTNNWAEDKVFTGTQAIALGLINEIGSLCTVVKILKEKALIEGEIKWIQQAISSQKALAPSLLHSFFMQM